MSGRSPRLLLLSSLFFLCACTKGVQEDQNKIQEQELLRDQLHQLRAINREQREKLKDQHHKLGSAYAVARRAHRLFGQTLASPKLTDLRRGKEPCTYNLSAALIMAGPEQELGARMKEALAKAAASCKDSCQPRAPRAADRPRSRGQWLEKQPERKEQQAWIASELAWSKNRSKVLGERFEARSNQLAKLEQANEVLLYEMSMTWQKDDATFQRYNHSGKHGRWYRKVLRRAKDGASPPRLDGPPEWKEPRTFGAGCRCPPADLGDLTCEYVQTMHVSRFWVTCRNTRFVALMDQSTNLYWGAAPGCDKKRVWIHATLDPNGLVLACGDEQKPEQLHLIQIDDRMLKPIKRLPQELHREIVDVDDDGHQEIMLYDEKKITLISSQDGSFQSYAGDLACDRISPAAKRRFSGMIPCERRLF